MHAAKLLLVSELSDTLVKGADVYVHYFDALVLVDLQFLGDGFWGTLYGKRLVRTLGG